MGFWFSKIYHYNRCTTSRDVHCLRSSREPLFPAWAYPWKFYKVSIFMECRVVFEHLFSLNSSIFLPSLANRRKSKFVERKNIINQNFGALACSAIVITDNFCAEFNKIQRTLLWFSQLKVSRPRPIFRQMQANVFSWRLKIGLGRETFSCENHKSVRWILLKALQSGRALFRWEDYYIVQNSMVWYFNYIRYITTADMHWL